jgi:pyruvate dehydrogenase (quinone)
VDLDKLFMDVAAYNERIMGPAHVNNVVDEAIKTALSRRMPVHITIPKDIQEWNTNGQRSDMSIEHHSADVYASRHPIPTREELQAAADLINAGKKVAILAGRGALHARDEVLELADTAVAPIVKALLDKAVVPDDSPFTTGGIGLLGTAPSSDVMQNCDTLITLGSSFPYIEFLPKPDQAKFVQIDIDPARIGLRMPVAVGLTGDCKKILRHLLPLIQRKEDRSFLQMAQEAMKKWNELLEKRASNTARPLKPQLVAYHVNKLLTDDTLVVSDTGTITTWAPAISRCAAPCSFPRRASWRRWPTACLMLSGPRSAIRASRSLPFVATAALPCSCARWRPSSSTSCRSR